MKYYILLGKSIKVGVFILVDDIILVLGPGLDRKIRWNVLVFI